MKTVDATFKEVYAIGSFGSDHLRKIEARPGSIENQFDLGVRQLRALAKKLKTDHWLDPGAA